MSTLCDTINKNIAKEDITFSCSAPTVLTAVKTSPSNDAERFTSATVTPTQVFRPVSISIGTKDFLFRMVSASPPSTSTNTVLSVPLKKAITTFTGFSEWLPKIFEDHYYEIAGKQWRTIAKYIDKVDSAGKAEAFRAIRRELPQYGTW